MSLDLQTTVIIHASSLPDTISLEHFWNAKQLGELRLAAHTSEHNRHNLLPKEMRLAAGGLRKIATRSPNFWQRQGDLLQNLPMGICPCLDLVKRLLPLPISLRVQRRKERVNGRVNSIGAKINSWTHRKA
jgi:hypothetical protein